MNPVSLQMKCKELCGQKKLSFTTSHSLTGGFFPLLLESSCGSFGTFLNADCGVK